MVDLGNILLGLKAKQQSSIVINGFLDSIASQSLPDGDLAFAAP
jgi:hypothetical protein